MANDETQKLILGPPPKKKKRTQPFQVDDIIIECSSSDTPTTPRIMDTPVMKPKETDLKMSKIRVFQVVSNSMTDISAPVKKKKPDPNAPKITRPCTECGKRFWSWKALFGHMRCHPERNWRGINPPKAKLRLPVAVTEEEQEELEVAACLLMLANGPQMQNPNPISGKAKIYSSDPVYKSFNIGSASTSLNPTSVDPEYKLMTTSGYDMNSANRDFESVTNLEDNIQFECSSCNKNFGSRQALGGHRASHKNVKGCFAIHHKGGDDMAEGGDVKKEKDAVALGHKCSTCLRVFSSGQALGGHMRCHFEKGGLNCLDLNLPAPVEDYYDLNHTFSRFSSGVALDLRLGI